MSNSNFRENKQFMGKKTLDFCFNSNELEKVSHVVGVSEELVNDYFKLSSSQWLKNRYDIKTSKDLEDHELLDGPFAQVVKYEGCKNDMALRSSSYSFYKVCLQDNAILSAISENQFKFDPFLLYILTHELVHVVRFSKFEKRYENKNESDVTFEEERTVHGLTYHILNTVTISGLNQVFDFYKDWIDSDSVEIRLKNLERLS